MEDRQMYKITRAGQIYPSYSGFFEENNLMQYAHLYHHGATVSNLPLHARRFYLISVHEHYVLSSVKIALIQEVNSQQVFIINRIAITEAD